MAADFLSFLTQGSTPPATTTTSDVQSSVPAWYNSYLGSLATNAAQIASNPYQTYGGARIAPQNAQEKQGFDFLGENATNWQQPLNAATSAASSVAGGFNQDQFSKYMNPYTSGVVNEIGRLGHQNLTESALPALDAEFIGSGQRNGPVSDRAMTMGSRLVRDTEQNILGQQGAALSQGFNSSMGAYEQGQTIANQGAQNLGGLAQANQALTTGTAGSLAASGQTQRGYDQGNYDLAYQDFQNQANYPRQNVAFLSAALRGSNIPTTQDATTTAPYSGSMSPSPLAIAAGTYGLTKAAHGGLIRGYRRGGHVPRFAVGGLGMTGMPQSLSDFILPGSSMTGPTPNAGYSPGMPQELPGMAQGPLGLQGPSTVAPPGMARGPLGMPPPGMNRGAPMRPMVRPMVRPGMQRFARGGLAQMRTMRPMGPQDPNRMAMRPMRPMSPRGGLSLGI